MVTGRTGTYARRVRLLAVVAGLCLFTGGMIMLPSWLRSVFGPPYERYVRYVPLDEPPPVWRPGWEDYGMLLLAVGLLCGCAALLWWIVRLIARLR